MLFRSIAQQGEGEAPGLGEGRVAEGAVPADPEERDAAIAELVGDLDQAAELRRSDAAEVVAVEHQHHVGLALELFQRDRSVERRREREAGSGLTPS